VSGPDNRIASRIVSVARFHGFAGREDHDTEEGSAVKRTIFALALAGTLVFPAVGSAQVAAPAAYKYGVEGKFSFTIKAGAETNWGGGFVNSGTGTILSLPAQVDEQKYNDVYGMGWRLSLGVGYGFSRNIEGIAAYSFGMMGGKDTQIGTAAGLPFFAKFDDYKDWSLEFGGRFHFAPDSGFNPYVSALVGFRDLSAIPGTFSVPDVNVVFDNVGFYNDSIVMMYGFDFGVQFRMSDRAMFGIESGFRWQAKPGQVEGFAGTGMDNINDTGSRNALPILGTLTFYFE
jgi:hypothetical protein